MTSLLESARPAVHFISLSEKFWKAALKRRIKTCRAIIHWKVVEDAYEMAISINDVEPLEELRHELSLPGGRASSLPRVRALTRSGKTPFT